jgi:hypothetical protein
MRALSTSVESINTGQRVQTSFGTGVVTAVSHVDSIIYVTLSNAPSALYLFRPEQVEVLSEEEHK